MPNGVKLNHLHRRSRTSCMTGRSFPQGCLTTLRRDNRDVHWIPWISFADVWARLPGLATGLCHRRQWPEPLYDSYPTRAGVKCVVRVNNREYHTDGPFSTELLASENAAMRAYLICRNFSVNDGMYPQGHHQHGGPLQGMPVAIGRERRIVYRSDCDHDSSVSSGSRRGRSSPVSDRFPMSYMSGPTRRSDMSRVLNYGAHGHRYR